MRLESVERVGGKVKGKSKKRKRKKNYLMLPFFTLYDLVQKSILVDEKDLLSCILSDFFYCPGK